jgi:hypothetical protein
MTFTGRMRVHFNRHGAAPLVWCVSTDAWELAVSEVRFDDCQIKSVYRPKPTADDDDGKPSAWFEVDGTLRVKGSIATITAWEAAS